MGGVDDGALWWAAVVLQEDCLLSVFSFSGRSTLYAQTHIFILVCTISQSGSSTIARQMKIESQNVQRQCNVKHEKWKRKMPYDYTACPAHFNLTYTPQSSMIHRITGILEHNNDCKERSMSRFPRVPLHQHVWQDALDQINQGARYKFISHFAKHNIQYLQYNGGQKTQSRTLSGRAIWGPENLRPPKGQLPLFILTKWFTNIISKTSVVVWC